MSILIPGRGQEFAATVAETLGHRDHLIVGQIGEAAVAAALEELDLDNQAAAAMTDPEFEVFKIQPQEVSEDVPETPLSRYDGAFTEAIARVRGLFGVVEGYGFGYINAGQLFIERGHMMRADGMTTMMLTAVENDLRVDKTRTKMSLDEENMKVRSATDNLEVSFGDHVTVERAVARLKQVNQALRGSLG